MTTLLTMLLLAQAPEPLRAAFSQQGSVVLPGRPGDWARLPLPDTVLRQVERDLADVRLVDASGVLVPFVIQRERAFDPEKRVWLTQISATRKETPAGQGTPNLYEETALFSLPTTRARTPRLEFSTSTSRFVRKVVIDALTEKGTVVGHLETTFFRLSQAEQLSVWLPALEREAVRVRVTLTGQDDGFLSPSAVATFAERGPPETTLLWPITAAPVTDGKSTVYRFEKPKGIVPMRLSIKTTTPWFSREIVGLGRVFRQAGYTPVDRLSLPFTSNGEGPVEITINNEDSPPLEHLELAFEIEQPELVFTIPAVQPVTLYFGGNRTRRAHFDTSDVEVRLPFDLEASMLRDLKPNPDFIPAAPLTAFRKPGAAVPVSEFAHLAWVRGVSGTEVSSVLFTAFHAQTMAADFRDLRLVDAQGQQWPYVLKDSTAMLPVPLTEAKASAANHSAWTFTVAGRVVSFALIPPAGAPYFSRSATVTFQREGLQPQRVWSGWLTSNPDNRGARSELLISLDSTARGEGTYTLELDDGGDAPLSGLALESTVTVPQLTAVLAAGDYRALWGAPSQHAARYDLERVSDVLQELRTTPRAAEPPTGNPSFVAPTLLEQTGGATRWLFWAVLGLAVLVLGGLTVRIARSEQPKSPSGKEE